MKNGHFHVPSPDPHWYCYGAHDGGGDGGHDGFSYDAHDGGGGGEIFEDVLEEGVGEVVVSWLMLLHH